MAFLVVPAALLLPGFRPVPGTLRPLGSLAGQGCQDFPEDPHSLRHLEILVVLAVRLLLVSPAIPADLEAL